MKKWGILIALSAAVFFFTGCRNTENQNTSESSTTAKTEDKTFELTDSLGNKVVIPEKPKRIIGSYLEDYLVALGITPVAQWSVNDGASIQDYLQKQLKDIPTIAYDLPYEAVASFKPDLLLIGSTGTVEGGKYEQYAKIAPTYVVKNGETVSWKEQLSEIGKVLKMEDKAKTILKDYEKKAEAAKEKLSESNPNESAAVLWIVNNSAFMVSKTASSGAVLYEELGLKVPKLVEEVSKTATSDWSAVSLEKLAELDADSIFLVNSDRETGADLLKDDIWKNIPAVKNGKLYEFGPESSWLYKGPIANTEIIQDVLNKLTK